MALDSHFINLGFDRYVMSFGIGYYHMCAFVKNGLEYYKGLKCWGARETLGHSYDRDYGILPGQMGDDLPYVISPPLTSLPTKFPSTFPSFIPSVVPSGSPSVVPTPQPHTSCPSYSPSTDPSTEPSNSPSVIPSDLPSNLTHRC